MNKELSKVIMNKSRLRNKYIKWHSRENFLALKKMKNERNTRKTKKRYFEYITKNKNFAMSKTFWNAVRPFITNKGKRSKLKKIKIFMIKIKIKTN